MHAMCWGGMAWLWFMQGKACVCVLFFVVKGGNRANRLANENVCLFYIAPLLFILS